MKQSMKQRHIWFGLLLILLVTIVHGWYGWQQAHNGLNLGSDQLNIGVMALKLRNPELFTRDYVFSDPEFFSFYTPGFLLLVSWLTDLAGGYGAGLALLIMPVTFLYICGMWLMLVANVRHTFLALTIAIASVYVAETLGGTLWGVAGLRRMIPRTLFLCLFPWWIYLWQRWQVDAYWWQRPLLGLLLGAMANLHPVSAFVMCQIFISSELWQGRSKWRELSFWTTLCLTLFTLLLGAWPTASNYIQNSDLAGGISNSEDFTLFRQAVHFSFSTVFPFHSTQLQVWVGKAGQIILVGWQLFSLACCAFFLWQSEKVLRVLPLRRAIALLILAQVPVIFFITDGSSLILLVVLMGYIATLFLNANPYELTTFDYWAIFLLTLICTLTMVGSFFVEWLWSRFSWWSITNLVGEQGRIAKFIYLPLYLLAARWLDWRLSRLGPDQRGWALFVYGTALLMAVHRPVALLLLPIWYTICWLQSEQAIKPWRWLLTTFLVVLGTGLITVDHLWLLYPWQIGLIVATVLLIISTWMAQGLLFSSQGFVAASACVIISLGLLLLPITETPIAAIGTPARYQALIVENKEREDAQKLYLWARQETAVEAIFYTDAFELRLYAERAITHSTKDWGTATYRREGLVAIAQRWQRLRTAYSDELILLSRAAEVEADYLYVQQDSAVRLDRPVVYSNDSFIVYDLSPDID